MKTSFFIPLSCPLAGTDEIPVHRPLPRCIPLLEALPRLGPVCLVSRNGYAVAGAEPVYPDVHAGEATGDVFLEPALEAWRVAWHNREWKPMRDKVLEGIEFRDAAGAGFHKVPFTEPTDVGTCQVAKLRNPVAGLILEDSDRDVGEHPAACSQTQTQTHLARP